MTLDRGNLGGSVATVTLHVFRDIYKLLKFLVVGAGEYTGDRTTLEGDFLLQKRKTVNNTLRALCV